MPVENHREFSEYINLLKVMLVIPFCLYLVDNADFFRRNTRSFVNNC